MNENGEFRVLHGRGLNFLGDCYMHPGFRVIHRKYRLRVKLTMYYTDEADVKTGNT